MTSVSDLRVLYDYGYWANAKLFAVISLLTDQQFTQAVAGTDGSVRNTLVHMMSAEWGWLDRCGGEKRGPALVPADYPSFASVLERWHPIEAHVRRFLTTLTDSDLDRMVEFSFGQGPKYAMRVGDLMHHAAIHNVHHRGQLSLLLRALGHAPGNADILFYYGRDQAK